MKGRSAMAATLAAARAVEAVLARLDGSRALRLADLAERTSISPSRLRRLLPAMAEAGWPVVALPDPVTVGPPCNRPRVYSLVVPDEMRQANCDGSQEAR